MLKKIRDLLLSPYYTLFIFVLSATGYLFGDGGIIAVMFIEVQLVALVLCLSDDLAPVLLPALQVIVLGTTFIGKTELLFAWVPYGLTLIPAAVFHFIAYRKKLVFRAGISFWGVIAAAAAILLSGMGNHENTDYTDGTVIYYLLAMSVGLVALYFLFAVEVKREKPYDQIQYFLTCLLYVGALCAVIVLSNFSKWIFGAEDGLSVYEYFSTIPYRNTFANLLTLCLPAPFYFAGYAAKRHSSHIAFFLLGCVLYGAMLLTVARTAMLFGTVVLICCLVYYLRGREMWYYKVASILIGLLGLAVLVFSIYEPIIQLFTSRLDDGLASLSETRWHLFLRSISDFLEHPIFGIGFASFQNADLYAAEGCISWYHLYFPQIWGSLGLVGCAAYAYQLFIRLKLSLFRPNAKTVAIALCYLGIFLYSQTDPGEFIPIPFAALAVLMFVFLEHHYEIEKAKQTQVSE